ncbi:MAG: STAS/SEC14 domain-containing protein [Breznakibacter sp.]|nr:STAS/SEC14 domain-containing protein [Breznakibacter sp.]
MYTITKNCRGFITLVSCKDQQTMEDFEHFTKEIGEFASNNKLYLLTDFRQAKISFNQDEVYKMGEIERNFGPRDLSVVEAVVCQSPLEKALSLFYNTVKKGSDYTLKFFSSEDDALKWLRSYHEYVPKF